MMRGEFLDVWSEMWEDVWLPIQSFDEEIPAELVSCLGDCALQEDYEYHPDIFSALYTEAFRAFSAQLAPNEFNEPTTTPDLAAIANGPELAFERFHELKSSDFASEGALVEFLEKAFEVFGEYDELLAVRYKRLLSYFISKYSLRYEVAEPFLLCPTLPGAFSSLFSRLTEITNQNDHLSVLMQDFMIAFRAIRDGTTDDRIRHCIHKLILVTEGVSSHHANMSGKALGDACKEIKSWPHDTVKQSLLKLYGFTSSYPGIRHAGNPNTKDRELDARDLVAICIILSGYAPYLTDIDCEDVYLARSGGAAL